MSGDSTYPVLSNMPMRISVCSIWWTCVGLITFVELPLVGAESSDLRELSQMSTGNGLFRRLGTDLHGAN
jgi:hypothetical protein